MLVWLILATVGTIIALVPSLGLVVISPMMLTGAGEPTSVQWFAVYTSWLTPVVFVLSIIVWWVLYAMKLHRPALIASFVPLVWIIFAFIVLLIWTPTP